MLTKTNTYMFVLLYFLFSSFNISKGFLTLNLNIDNFSIDNLTHHVVETYMVQYKCIVLISEGKHNLAMRTNIHTLPSLRISVNFNNQCQDKSAFDFLASVFIELCQGYIIQITKPECFLKLWASVAQDSPHRHTPRMFILPTTGIARTRDIFLIREAEFVSDILVAEWANSSSETCFHLWTNNFYEQVPLPTSANSRNTSDIYLTTWCEETYFLTESPVQLYPDKIANLQGKELRLFTWTYPPYAILKPLDGTEVRIAIEFCRLYNCTYVVGTDSFMWGEVFENKTGGNGPVGAVYMDRADIGFSGLYLWEREHRYLDYSTPYLYSSVTCMVPKPLLLPGWWLHLLPFSKEIWMALFISILIATITLYVIARATLKYTRLGVKLKRHTQFTSWTDSFVRVIGLAVLQTPPTQLITNAPHRHLFTWFEILFLLLTSCYSGGLSSFLTLPLSYPAVDTIEQLVESNMLWAADHEAWIYSMLNSSDANMKILVDRFEVHSHKELTRLALGREYAISIERLPGGHMCEEKHMSVDAISKRRMMKEHLYGSPIVMVLRKGSPYNRRLNALIHRILDHGLLLFWERDVSRQHLSSRVQIAVEQSAAPLHVKSHPTELKLSHVEGAFILLAIGLGASAICFFLERHLHKRKKETLNCLSDSTDGKELFKLYLLCT